MAQHFNSCHHISAILDEQASTTEGGTLSSNVVLVLDQYHWLPEVFSIGNGIGESAPGRPLLCAAVLFSRRCRRSRSKQVRASLMCSILNASEMLKHSFDAKGRNSPPGFWSLFLVSIASVCQSKSCCAGLATKCWLSRAFAPTEFREISRDICKKRQVFLPRLSRHPLPFLCFVVSRDVFYEMQLFAVLKKNRGSGAWCCTVSCGSSKIRKRKGPKYLRHFGPPPLHPHPTLVKNTGQHCF